MYYNKMKWKKECIWVSWYCNSGHDICKDKMTKQAQPSTLLLTIDLSPIHTNVQTCSEEIVKFYSWTKFLYNLWKSLSIYSNTIINIFTALKRETDIRSLTKRKVIQRLLLITISLKKMVFCVKHNIYKDIIINIKIKHLLKTNNLQLLWQCWFTDINSRAQSLPLLLFLGLLFISLFISHFIRFFWMVFKAEHFFELSLYQSCKEREASTGWHQVEQGRLSMFEHMHD